MPMTNDHSPSTAPRAHGISKTAIWVAAGRAIGAREPDLKARNPDRLAEALLGDPSRLELQHPIVDALRLSYEQAMQDLETAGLVRAMTERTRFIDEALERAIGAGAVQVLIPGAGLDSHAYRCGELLAGVRVFEVDRPETLAFKKRRVAEALGGPPANLTYVPLELEREELPAVLARHGYDAARRTFVILEGVTMYVPEQALRALFGFIASHPKGSSVVFDFASRPMIDGIKKIDLASLPPVARPSVERFLALTENEPWVFGFPVDGEAELLASVGLTLRETVTIGSEESSKRYLTRADGTIVGAEGHAKAEALRKAATAKLAEQMSPEQLQKMQEGAREQQRQMAYRIAEAVC
jgi:methyltransferase (TIGR00027 family)